MGRSTRQDHNGKLYSDISAPAVANVHANLPRDHLPRDHREEVSEAQITSLAAWAFVLVAGQVSERGVLQIGPYLTRHLVPTYLEWYCQQMGVAEDPISDGLRWGSLRIWDDHLWRENGCAFAMGYPAEFSECRCLFCPRPPAASEQA